MRKTLGTLALAFGLAATGTPAMASPGDAFAAYMKTEGGDTQRCVTYREFNAARLGDSKQKVRELFDTTGHRVGKRAMKRHVGAFLDLLGLSAGQVETAARSHREIRRYPTCAEDGVPALVLVEFNTRADRADQLLWE
jgi:hypothetical protein